MEKPEKAVRHGHQTEEIAARYLEEYPWSDLLAMEISLRIFNASAAQSAALNRMFAAMGDPRTRGRYTALRVLYFAEGRRLSQNEMRAAMNVSSPNITYLVDELEKEGLARRVPSREDRRTTFVELTDSGEALISVLAPAMARFMTDMSRAFSNKEKQTLRDLLARFQENASQYNPE